ncbi:amidohydrolase [Microbacterium hydrocarbonoxydans]|uniref:amidohydrolase n=1 Tax=Microbacterium hydrocarbonoxydans TaxID=273678 RepID=UPI003D97AB07
MSRSFPSNPLRKRPHLGKRSFAAAAAVVVTAAVLTSCTSPDDNSADIVFKNGVVHTSDAERSTAEAVAVRGDEIVFVGSMNDVDMYVGDNTKVIDLDGRAIVPGLIDAHTHPDLVVLSSWKTELPATQDLTEIQGFLRDFAAEHPVSEVPYIEAEYYDTGMDWGPEGPNAAAIDAAVSDRPVLLNDWSGHASTMNSKMMEILGIDASTPLVVDETDPAVQFTRGEDGVTPTGQSLEGAWRINSEQLWDEIGWRPPEEVTPDLLEEFTSYLSGYGVTTMFSAIAGEDQLKSAAALDEEGRLDLDFHGAAMISNLDELDDKVAEVRDLQEQYGGDHVHINTMKLFLDGTNEIKTSAVLEPFEGDPGNTGELRMSEPDLKTLMTRLNDEGMDLHIHICGDRAYRVALDVVEELKAELGDKWKLQVTIAHADIVDPADYSRAAELGIVVNWTPHWGGGVIGTAALDTLGEERFNRMYQFNPLIDAGTVVSFSSDVVSTQEKYRANPYLGMQIGHTRSDPEYPPAEGPGTVPGTSIREPLSAQLSLEDLLQGYTLNGAIQLGIDSTTGSLEVGKKANLAVLDEDLFDVEVEKIQDIEPSLVMFEGKVVKGTVD